MSNPSPVKPGTEDVSIIEGVRDLYERAKKSGIETVWDRFQRQQPQCKMGILGVCCRNCAMGPCRVIPTSHGTRAGVCGATADTIVARNLLRMIAAGAAAHSDHARDILFVVRAVAEGKTHAYEVRDRAKLRWIAERLGVDTEGKSDTEILRDIVRVLEREFGKQDDEPLALVKALAPRKRMELWSKLGVVPRSIDREICEALHRTHVGVDADPFSLIAHGVRTALADGWSGSMMATLLSDVLFGTPRVIRSRANLGVLKEDYVNIVVHGHNPVLSMKIVEAAMSDDMQKLAQEHGARGINVVGMCCTGNEVLMRLGVPPAGNFLMQELAIATGAVEAMIVDYQCVMPSLVKVAECYHTKIVTTEKKMKIPGALHVEFEFERADEVAREIVRIAVENYSRRSKVRVSIPNITSELVAGFSVEAIVEILGGSLKPLLDLLREGTIKGVVAIVGCNNPKVKHCNSHVTLTRKLIKNDVLVVGTGCWAIAAAMSGLLRPEAAREAGPGLRQVCEELKIPPCLHMGSCVDCSRILLLLRELAEMMNVDISDLPVAGSAPEWMSEKAVSIGTYFVASGVFVHLGVAPPVLGSQTVTSILTEEAEKLLGGRFYIEENPEIAAEVILQVIEEKRKRLGWPT